MNCNGGGGGNLFFKKKGIEERELQENEKCLERER